MNVRLVISCAVALALAGFAVGQAGSQTIDYGVPTPPPSLQLLERPDVQTDLHLGGGQKSGLATIRQKSARQAKGHSTGIQNVQFVRAAMRERAIQENREAESLLSDEQRKRLQEGHPNRRQRAHRRGRPRRPARPSSLPSPK